MICAEALSSLLTQAEKKGIVTGVPTSKNGPRLSHLFFAYDCLLFCKANLVEWRCITKILEKYEVASGQCLNKNKTSIFSRNTSLERRNEITQLLGLQTTHSFDKDFGLPALVGKSRYLSLRILRRKCGAASIIGKIKFLSQAGKEVLLKAVVQAIPMYNMSVFQLPVVL